MVVAGSRRIIMQVIHGIEIGVDGLAFHQIAKHFFFLNGINGSESGADFIVVNDAFYFRAVGIIAFWVIPEGFLSFFVEINRSGIRESNGYGTLSFF